MSTTGEKPGVGVYVCVKCQSPLVLNDQTDKLPPCPKCNGTLYIP
ncbi:MAG: zinc ribbon-containing protein [Silvanigrellaceae bacterium]|nr:zinc ribbon-containing protein [Silvanigrellaceae bacterium]